MRLPLYGGEEERVSELAEVRLPLPNALALVSAGHDDALRDFVDALRRHAVDVSIPIRILRVAEGELELEQTRARVRLDRREAFRDALEGSKIVTIGAVVPALFAPMYTIAFARSTTPLSYPSAARIVCDTFDAVLADSRPGIIEDLVSRLASR